MPMIRLQLTASDEVANELINRLTSLEGVEHVEEIGDLMPHMDDDDSSSAGLPDDAAPGFHHIEVHVPNDRVMEQMRLVAETLVSEREAALEYDEDF